MDDIITDEDLNRWKEIAQVRLEIRDAPDPASLGIIIRLCDKLLEERHPKNKPAVWNLLHQGDQGRLL